MFFFQFASLAKAHQFEAVVNYETGLTVEAQGINCKIMNLFTRAGYRVHIEWLQLQAERINAS